jgi:sugar O-acyltransferase (sialic acid O-acetyltransferase NeuD family)
MNSLDSNALTPRRLLIIGAGGFGRELESWLDRIPEPARDWRIHGYLDDDPGALEGYPSEYTVVGDLDRYEFAASDLVILGIANPDTKRAIVERLKGRVDFFTFVPPDALIGKGVRFGRGVVVGMDCMFTTNVDVGDFATVNSHSSVAHDVRIGAYASLMGNVSVSGNCKIGDFAMLGACSTLIPGRRVGEHAVVAASAAVFRHVAPHSTVVGNPAREFLHAPRTEFTESSAPATTPVAEAAQEQHANQYS